MFSGKRFLKIEDKDQGVTRYFNKDHIVCVAIEDLHVKIYLTDSMQELTCSNHETIQRIVKEIQA